MRFPRSSFTRRRACSTLAGVLWLSCLAWACAEPATGRMVRVVFRLDDFAQRSDAALERAILEAFAQRNLPLVVGVIPFQGGRAVQEEPAALALDEAKIALLREAVAAGVVEVALHGCTHASPTEFAGANEEEQARRLAPGKRLLEAAVGAPVRTFLPPWNLYDANTVRALEKLGFSVLSANRDSPAPLDSTLHYIPFTCQPHHLKEAVAAARRTSDPAPMVVVMMHYESFAESGRREAFMNMDGLRALLDWVRAQSDVRVSTFQAAAADWLDADARHQTRLATATRRNAYLPPPLRTLDHRINPSSVFLEAAWRKAAAALGAFYGLIALGAAAGGIALEWAATRLGRPRVAFIAAAAAVAGTMVLHLVLRRHGAAWPCAAAWTAAAALCAGVAAAVMRRRSSA